MTAGKLRIVIAEDHALVRSGLRALLSQLPEIEIAAEAADGHQAVEIIKALRPDIALLDISMPGLNGLEVAARVAETRPYTKIIILSMHSDAEYLLQALRAGALGYVLKDSDASELEEAIRTVSRGKQYLCQQVRDRLGGVLPEKLTKTAPAAPPESGPFHMLTPRQREVLQLITEGLTTKQIALKLDISIKTVETYRAQIMDRLNIRDIAGLVRYAIRSGLAGLQ